MKTKQQTRMDLSTKGRNHPKILARPPIMVVGTYSVIGRADGCDTEVTVFRRKTEGVKEVVQEMAATGKYREIVVAAPVNRNVLVDAYDGATGELCGIFGGIELEESPPKTSEPFEKGRADSEFRRLVPDAERFKGVVGSVTGARACAGDMTNVRSVIASARSLDGGSSVEHMVVVDVDAVRKTVAYCALDSCCESFQDYFLENFRKISESRPIVDDAFRKVLQGILCRSRRYYLVKVAAEIAGASDSEAFSMMMRLPDLDPDLMDKAAAALCRQVTPGDVYMGVHLPEEFGDDIREKMFREDIEALRRLIDGTPGFEEIQ